MEENIQKEDKQEKEAASKGGERPEEISVQEDELTKCQKERDEYLDGWKRAKADLINYKKDETKRFEKVVMFSNESLVRELINVLDSFDLALVALEAEDDSKKEKGLYLIRQQLEDLLKRVGLERIIISIGQPFDPGLQEAIASIESDKPAGTVIEEVEKGYLLNGKLIRPARVKVVK
jgi:molecular chaperone GrpE